MTNVQNALENVFILAEEEKKRKGLVLNRQHIRSSTLYLLYLF